ncbi:MAG TPA: sulfatase [Planctomycetota bacterium]
MADAPEVMRRADPLAYGLRCGTAAALLELGLAWSGRGSGGELLETLAFAGLPVAVYGFAGLLLGGAGAFLQARTHGRVPGAVVPLFALLGLAAADLVARAPLLRLAGPPGWFALLLAAGLVAPWGRLARTPARVRFMRAGFAGVVLAGAVATAAWLVRDPEQVRLPLPATSASADLPNVVLVTWDTVRADLLPIYGGRGLETPVLDTLAAESVVFDEMTAVAPITGPSHASLLTGRMPPSHGLRSNGSQRIHEAVPTLAEGFRAAGYDTGAFVAAFPVHGRFGFARGFRIFDDRPEQRQLLALIEQGRGAVRLYDNLSERMSKSDYKRTRGEVVIGRAERFVAGSQRPFFLWVHLFDAHGPHKPGPEFRARALALAGTAQPAADVAACGASLTDHRAEIMQLDAHLGALRAALEAADPGLAHTTLLLTSDHGHCFGEGGIRNKHVPSLFEATQHIPAVLRLPGGVQGGARVAGLVSQVDVAATLAGIAGIEPPADHQGRDLRPFAATGTAPPPPGPFAEGLYMEAWHANLVRRVDADGSVRDNRKQGLRVPGWKLVTLPGQEAAGMLYRIAGGRETEVPAGEETERRGILLAALERLRAALPTVPETAVAISREDMRALAALGYADDPDGP